MLIHKESNSLLLRLQHPELVQKVIPDWSKSIDYEGHNLAVKFDLEVIRVLRNMGIKAPLPIRYQYHWPRPASFTTVFEHQIITAEMLTLHPRMFVLNEMGTSKTASALWAADYLMMHGFVGKCLIVAPLSTLDLVWANEIFNVLMTRTCAVLHGSRAKRLDLLARDFPFYIINHDGLRIIQSEIQKRKDINLIIVDESAAYRNGSNDRYDILAKTIQPWHRLWLMTGTPCPNAPTDAWAQVRLVNPNNVPKYFGQWRRQTMTQLSQYKWVARPESYEMAYKAMQPAVRFKKSECLDLPPMIMENRQTKLTPEQANAFKEMKKEAVAEVVKGVPITAANAADKINKLRQILCIASGTLILTPNGWKEIQTLTTDELVWDGLSWVRHGGVLDNGVQPVVMLYGVRMTKDHEVLTRSGWQTAGNILNDQSSYRFDGASFWLPDCFAPVRNDGRGIAKSNVAMPMLLRKHGGSGEPEPSSKEASERKALRVSAHVHQLQASHVIHQALSGVERPEAAMHRPHGQRLEELWRAGYNGLHRMVGQLQQFLVRHAGRLLSGADTGPARQREGVQQRELQVGDPGTAGEQHPEHASIGHPEGGNDTGARVKKLRPEDSDAFLSIEGGMVGRESTSDPCPEMAHVFDIKDCGPRNRFVVQGTDGLCFIVHNCGVIKDKNTGTYVELPHAPRLETLMEGIEQAAAKVLVIVPFKGIIQSLHRDVSKVWKCDVVNGDVSRVQRTKIFQQFKSDPDLKLLLCHPRVMAHGITATDADMIIFYGPIYSNDEAQQVIERINRPGQTRKMTVLRIGASALEWGIYNMVEGKKLNQDTILELYKKELQIA